MNTKLSNFYLIGHANPLGIYPAIVVPIVMAGAACYAVYGDGAEVTLLQIAQLTFVRHSTSLTAVLAPYKPSRHKLFAFQADAVICYPIRHEHLLFLRLLAIEQFASTHPFIRLALARLTNNGTSVRKELTNVARSLAQSTGGSAGIIINTLAGIPPESNPSDMRNEEPELYEFRSPSVGDFESVAPNYSLSGETALLDRLERLHQRVLESKDSYDRYRLGRLVFDEMSRRTRDRLGDGPLRIICDSASATVPWELAAMSDRAQQVLDARTPFVALEEGLTRRLDITNYVPSAPLADASRHPKLLVIESLLNEDGFSESAKTARGVYDECCSITGVQTRFVEGQVATPAGLGAILRSAIVDAIYIGGPSTHRTSGSVREGSFVDAVMLLVNAIGGTTPFPRFVFIAAAINPIDGLRVASRMLAAGAMDVVFPSSRLFAGTLTLFATTVLRNVLGASGYLMPGPGAVKLARLAVSFRAAEAKDWSAFQHYSDDNGEVSNILLFGPMISGSHVRRDRIPIVKGCLPSTERAKREIQRVSS